MTRAARELARLERQLPGVAASLARSLRSGATLPVAVDELARSIDAPARDDLAHVLRASRAGVPLDDALSNWASARRSRSVDLLVAACRFGHAEGGDPAAALDGCAVSLLDGIEVADEARAVSSQARASAAVLVALPVLGALGFSVLDPSVAATLCTTTPGLVCLVLGLLLDGTGAWVIARMVRSAIA
jgi:tight adherence protein B